MYLVELTLKANPLALSVQRKEQKDADALYQEILTALKTSHPQVLELTCERQPEKKVAAITSEIMAVQISEKSSANSGLGTRAGFLAGGN